ncbi:MAG TPA: phenylacetate--CoA ligase family protein [Actinomycetota bacterium]|jgi:phenylacetate-CoA ligase|nr:phenylacetate--CoA ligase family protein [Actinomycetota bacterium]
MKAEVAPDREAMTIAPASRGSPPLWWLRLVLPPLDWIFRYVGPRYGAFIWMVRTAPPQMLAAIGRWRAVRAADHAYRRVPAYRAFLDAPPTTAFDTRRLRVPAMGKDSYIRRYPLEERCVDGRLPAREVAIDESSGSTGTPYNWIRSLPERVTSHRFIGHFARYCFGEEPFITINAFSMGAWATGVNMGIALQRIGIVKNTGPDVDKILNTLEFLGPGHRFLICGYPPFMKFIIDTAKDRGFPLQEYRLMSLVGGEGMSEGLRDYVSSTFSPVYSGYGATDLEIGIAGETPLSVAIRRAARGDASLRRALFGEDSRLPMVFQYNPLNHYIVVNEERELMFTISRLEVLSPRVMYNIHDEGGVATFREIGGRFREAGRDLRDLVIPSAHPLELPFLWIYGRKDSTVSVMGANIYPEDVEQALYDEPELAAVTNSFCLSLHEGADGGLRPCFSFELRADNTPELQAAFEQRITERIRQMNLDFRQAMEEHPESARPVVQLFSLGTGPFSADATRIKQTRIITVAAS